MNITPSSDNMLLGSGALYCAIYKDGKLDGEFHFGNVTNFSIGTADEVKEKYGSMDKSRGLLKAVTTKRTVTLKVTGDYFSPENLMLNTMGELGTFTQAAGAQAAITLTTAAKKGRFYALAHRNVSNVVVKSGATTFAAGTDYQVDTVSGRVYVSPTGAITEGATVTAAYDYATVSAQTIEGGKAGLIEAFIRFIGDPAAGPAYEVQVFKVQLTPDGELGFISDDFGAWSLTGKVLADTTKPSTESPYYKAIKLN